MDPPLGDFQALLVIWYCLKMYSSCPKMMGAFLLLLSVCSTTLQMLFLCSLYLQTGVSNQYETPPFASHHHQYTSTHCFLE